MPLTAIWKRTARFEDGAVPMLMGGRGAAKTALFLRRCVWAGPCPDASGDKAISGLAVFWGGKMADFTSWKGLCEAVADYLGRDDLTERIPAFIALAERRMNRELRLRVMERRAETDVSAGQSAVPLPWRRQPGNWDVFLEMRDLTFEAQDGSTANLAYAPPDTYGQRRVPGSVREYTIIGRDLFLLPAPDADGTLYLTYYAEVEPLGENQPDNAVLLTVPDLYLYGALVESGPFTRGSVPLETWTQYYVAAKRKAEESEQRARFTANITMRPTRRV